MLFFKFDSLVIEAMKHIDDINYPGKFEGEPRYSPYFYNLWLHRHGEYLNPNCADCELSEMCCDTCHMPETILLDLDHVDRRLFPESQGIKQVSLYESDSGFVYCEPYS